MPGCPDGHMVFTTLHANDSVTALVRFLDLGVQPATLASAVSAVAQRLVRMLCPKCKVRYKPNPEVLRKANLPAEKIKYFFRPPESTTRKPCATRESPPVRKLWRDGIAGGWESSNFLLSMTAFGSCFAKTPISTRSSKRPSRMAWSPFRKTACVRLSRERHPSRSYCAL